jgi:predicted CoA-binding protein
MNERIENFIKSKHIAVVGVSERKFGGAIYKDLKTRGYKVYPVHPTMETFDGDRCFPTLKSIPEQVDAAVIAVSPANAEKVVEDARNAGIAKLWFQRGADFSKVVEKADTNGMQVVSGKCVLMYAPPVTGIHAVHRFFARLFRSL